MSTAFWLATAQTVVFLALCAWAWWATGRIAELLNAADTIKAHTEAAAQHATRAGLNARAMLDVLEDWWETHRQPPVQPEPVTEPMRRTGPDTVPEAQAVSAAPDEWVAEQMAAIHKKLGITQEPGPDESKPKPAPRKRTGSTAAKKATATVRKAAGS